MSRPIEVQPQQIFEEMTSEQTRPESVDHPGATIFWEPDRKLYEARKFARVASGSIPAVDLPNGWPSKISSPLAWGNNTFPIHSDYIVFLSPNEIEEIETAVTTFKETGLKLNSISRESFPLPRLQHRISQLAASIWSGPGLFVLRGLDTERYSAEENTIMFVGISCYVGKEAGPQDSNGCMISHIVDPDCVFDSGAEDFAKTPAQPFHSDVACDTLAMQTRRLPAHGGGSLIASSWTVYNELARTRPDLVCELASSDWDLDSFGDRIPSYQRPLLFYHNSRIFLSFFRRLFTGLPTIPRTPGLRPLTEAQAEALDAVQFIAQENCLAIKLRPGDLSFLNNLCLLHGREAFTDSRIQYRHRVRLWLRNSEPGWELPPGLQPYWDGIFSKNEDLVKAWDVAPTSVSAAAGNKCGGGASGPVPPQPPQPPKPPKPSDQDPQGELRK